MVGLLMLAVLYGVTENFAAYLSEVTDGDLATPTPCASWTVEDLYRHVVEQNITLGQALDPNSPARLPSDDGMARETVYRHSARYASDALETAARTPHRRAAWDGFGELSVAQLAQLHTATTLLHTWDLAQATGFEFEAPGGDTIDDALDCMRRLPEHLRGSGKPFAEIVTFPALTTLDELLILSGRSPAWRAG